MAYIADDNEAAARRVMDDFYRKFEFLGRSRTQDKTRDDVTGGIRSFPAGECLIFYRVEKHRVVIMRVIHGRRDLPRLLQ